MPAAELVIRGSVPLEERQDLRRLAPDTYDTNGIAEALAEWCAEWCADGCDTRPPTPAELTFTGFGYQLTRNDQTVRASWYEGTYGVNGEPLR